MKKRLFIILTLGISLSPLAFADGDNKPESNAYAKGQDVNGETPCPFAPSANRPKGSGRKIVTYQAPVNASGSAGIVN